MRLSARNVVLGSLAIGIGFVVAVVLVLALDWAVGRLPTKPDNDVIEYAGDYWMADSLGIARPHPNGKFRSISRATATGRVIYDVTYTTDEHSRRVTPVQNPEGRSKHMMFFGCSFTYGEGVQDGETIPAQAAIRATGYRPYNYAFHGLSPAHMLAKLESPSIASEVGERDGILVYVFIDAQVRRAVGSMQIAGTWGRAHPYYVLQPDGTPVRRGDVTTGRPVLSAIYARLLQSNLLERFDVDFPIRIGDKHIGYTARLIVRSAQLYHERFPGGRFVTVIYPGSRFGASMAKQLAAESIEVLDYSTLFDNDSAPYILAPEDHHPSARADEVLARQLVLDLAIR